MKTRFGNFVLTVKILSLLSLMQFSTPNAFAVGYVGDFLDSHPSGTNNSVAPLAYGAAFGFGNSLAANSFGAAFGYVNTILNSGELGAVAIGYGNISQGGSIAIGDSNNVEWFCSALGVSNALGIDGSIIISAVGMNNVTYGGNESCMMIGWSNVLGNSSSSSPSQCVLLSGFLNTSESSQSCLISGGNNIASGAYYSGAIGYGLILNGTASGRLVAGQYNLGDETDELFVVGNGTDAVNPNNALVVHADGKVIISKAQGDILMGEFGN